MLFEKIFSPLLWSDWIYALSGKKKLVRALRKEQNDYLQKVRIVFRVPPDPFCYEPCFEKLKLFWLFGCRIMISYKLYHKFFINDTYS